MSLISSPEVLSDNVYIYMLEEGRARDLSGGGQPLKSRQLHAFLLATAGRQVIITHFRRLFIFAAHHFRPDRSRRSCDGRKVSFARLRMRIFVYTAGLQSSLLENNC